MYLIVLINFHHLFLCLDTIILIVYHYLVAFFLNLFKYSLYACAPVNHNFTYSPICIGT